MLTSSLTREAVMDRRESDAMAFLNSLAAARNAGSERRVAGKPAIYCLT
jgi:hypothetical protein